MKKILLILVIVLFNFSPIAEAHSGRTDASGGHNCSEKSKNAGKCTGYHYHNGGSNSSSSSNNNTPSTLKSNTKVVKSCADFATYDEVVEYWNKKGYSATYDPENLDGFGNNVVDDGIPCEPPKNYDLSKVNNSTYQKEAQDEQKGKVDGEKDGYNDGYFNSPAITQTSGSEAYQKSYTSSYNESYQKGQNQLKSERQDIYNQGYNLGIIGAAFLLPETLNVHTDQFEQGYLEGFNQFIEETKKQYEVKGNEDGLLNNNNLDQNWHEEYQLAYQKGFNQGLASLKESIILEGYDAAFIYDTFEEINLENIAYVDWYKEGYDSNLVAKEMKEYAYQLGFESNDYVVPNKYLPGENLFKIYYEKGLAESPNSYSGLIGFGVIATIAGGVGYRKYKNKK